jgi:hypothetical protein
MRPIAFVKVPADQLPPGVLFRGNWLKLKGPGDIAFCPMPAFGEGWVLARLPGTATDPLAVAVSRAG